MEQAALSFDAFAEDLARGLDTPYEAAGVDDELLAEEVKIGCTQALLLCLDREQRVAYILSEIFELPGAEAAEILEITPAAYLPKPPSAARAEAPRRRGDGGGRLTAPRTQALHHGRADHRWCRRGHRRRSPERRMRRRAVDPDAGDVRCRARGHAAPAANGTPSVAPPPPGSRRPTTRGGAQRRHRCGRNRRARAACRSGRSRARWRAPAFRAIHATAQTAAGAAAARAPWWRRVTRGGSSSR